MRGYAGISAGTLGTAREIRDARAFAEMIVDTVREGLLVLGLDLRVRAANESFYRLFAVAPEATIGRGVFDLGEGQWDIPELRTLLEELLPRDRVMNDFEVERDFPELGHRVMILNARRLDDHDMILLAIEDATERRQRERDLKELNETLEARVAERTRQVRHLSRELTLAQERERQRIAQVLHDDVQQLLYGARIAAAMGNAARLEAALAEAIHVMRALSHELGPPKSHSETFADLLEWLATKKREQYGLHVEIELRGTIDIPDPAMRALLYGILRELLFNVVKHAGVLRARVVAERVEGDVYLAVEDSGVGFDVATLGQSPTLGDSVGLVSIRERIEVVGGRLEIEAPPGAGTRVTIVMPVAAFGNDAA